LMEFERAGVIETMRGDLRRFKYKYGKLLRVMGEAHGLPITNNWDYKPGDFDDNDRSTAWGAPPWRGNKSSNQPPPDRRYDPDAMEPF
jgi:hypothetical protein